MQKRNRQAKKLFSLLKAKELKKKEALQHRIEKYIVIAEKREGDVELGKSLFTGMCLSCHVVGKTGAGFAPALDGSVHRDIKSLLTAILDPDAAIEGGYVLYRIAKKNGDILEGFLQNQAERGTAR